MAYKYNPFTQNFDDVGVDGVSTFLALTDTPATYASQGGKFLRVNGGETGIEFVNSSGVLTTLDTAYDNYGVGNPKRIFTDDGPVLFVMGNDPNTLIPNTVYNSFPFGSVYDTRIDNATPIATIGWSIVTGKVVPPTVVNYGGVVFNEILNSTQGVTVTASTNQIVFDSPVQDLTTTGARLSSPGDLISLSNTPGDDGVYVIVGVSTTTNANDTASVISIDPIGVPSFNGGTGNGQILGLRVGLNAADGTSNFQVFNNVNSTDRLSDFIDDGDNVAVNISNDSNLGNSLFISHNAVMSEAVRILMGDDAPGIEIQGYGAPVTNQDYNALRIVSWLGAPGIYIDRADVGLDNWAIRSNQWGVDTLGRIVTGTSMPTTEPSAQIHIESTTRGMLLPRMTSAQRNAIVSPANGLLVFDTTNNDFNFRRAGEWRAVLSTPAATFSPGNVVFATSAADTDDDDNFYWDNTEKALGLGTNSPNTTSILDLTSTTKGLLIPRMTTAQREAIVTPAVGLIVFDTTTGTNWINKSGGWFEDIVKVDGVSISLNGSGQVQAVPGYFVLSTEKGSANGVATLDAGSKIPVSQVPAIAITDTFVVASEVAQLALTVQKGDIAVRTDLNKSYINTTGNNVTMADWQELLTPTDSVQSVDGRTGVVTLNDLYEPKDAQIMKEGENVSLLNNNADYQSGTQVSSSISTHASDANAHHAKSHAHDGADGSGVVEGTSIKSTGETGGIKFLREDGDGTSSWQSIPSGVTGNNYVCGYDTTTQSISVANTFQDLTFNTNSLIDGWTHTVSTANFTCNQTGRYLVTFETHFDKVSGGGGSDIAIRVLKAGVEVAGSYRASTLSGNNIFVDLDTSCIISVTSGQVLKFQVASEKTGVEVAPGVSVGSPTVRPSASVTIVRLS